MSWVTGSWEVAPASAPRTLTRATARPTHGSYPGHGIRQARPETTPARTLKSPQTTKNQAQDLQSLDVPLHMSAHGTAVDAAGGFMEVAGRVGCGDDGVSYPGDRALALLPHRLPVAVTGLALGRLAL